MKSRINILTFVSAILIYCMIGGFSYSQSVTVLFPAGGETLRTGSIDNIAWESVGITSVDIYAYDGVFWSALYTDYPSADGKHTIAWSPHTTTSVAKVRVVDHATGTIQFISPNFSTIAPNHIYYVPTHITLQDAVAAATDGDIINIDAGIYVLTSTLNINHEITFKGANEFGVIINATGVASGTYGISCSKSNTSLSNFTLIPNSTNGSYAIHSSGGPNMQNVVLDHITINGANKTAFDFNGITYLTAQYLTATNTIQGNGVSIAGCYDANANHIVTSGNGWGGLATYVSNAKMLACQYITIDGTTSTFGENNKVYNQDESGLHNTNITVRGFDYALMNTTNLDYTVYQIDKVTAYQQAINSGLPARGSSILQISNGQYWVKDQMSIQPAINRAVSGSVINVEGGTYNEIDTVSKPMTIIGTSLPTVTGFILAASPVVITGFASTGTATVTVNPGGDINDALALVNSGGTVVIEDGTYPAFTINKAVSIIGGPGVIIANGSPAITITHTGVSLTGLTFNFNASSYAVAVQNGHYDVTIVDCNFLTVKGFGLINRGTGTVMAIHNYWNDPSGPMDAANPGGTGNRVTNNSTGSIIYSPWWSELAHLTLMGFPELVSPVPTITGISILPVFEWTWPGTGAHTFDLHITNGGQTIDVIGITTTTYQLLETDGVLANNSTYTWRVTARKGIYYAPSTTSSTFSTTVPAIALINYPGNSSIVYTYNPVMFSWSLSTAIGNLTFKLQYVREVDAGGIPDALDWANAIHTTTVICGNNLTSNTESLLPGTKYWWRVITYRGNDVVSYSTQQWFQTAGGAIEAAGIPSYPAGGATVYTNTPTLSWYTNIGDLTGITFDVQISTDHATWTNPATGQGLTGLSYVTDPLLPGTTYYWRVITHCSGDNNIYTSNYVSFVTNGTGTVAQPFVSYPMGGVTIYTQSPTFYWYLNAAATGITYHVFIDGIENGNVTDQLSFTTGLTLAPGSHTWQVVATNGNHAQDLSSGVATFVVAGGITQGIPVASWPVGNATIYTITPTVSWYLTGSTIGIATYTVKITTTLPTNNTTFWNNLPGGWDVGLGHSFTLPDPLLYGTIYYWAVASWDGSHYSVWSSGKFTTAGTTGSIVPIASYPTGGVTIYSTSATLSWFVNGSTVGIDHYRVVYSRRADLVEDGVNTFVNTSMLQSLNITDLIPGATYYWKVASDNGNSLSAYSNPAATFVVAATADASVIVPLVGSPINGVGLTTDSPELSWVIPTQATVALTYELQYSTQQDMSNPVTVSGINTLSQIVSGLASNQEYYWRVRSVNIKGEYSAYSEVGKFVVNSPTAVKEEAVIPTQFFVGQNYPNPFNPSTTIKYGLPSSANISIKVYDMLGQEVKTLVNGYKNAGTFSISWNGDNNNGNKVSSGTYIFRVISGTNIKTMKMILLK